MTLGLVSFILVETNSQINRKDKTKKENDPKIEIPKLVIVPLTPKIDTLLHKIDTIAKEQEETKIILINTSKRSDSSLEKLQDIEEFARKSIKDSIVFDTIIVYKTTKDSTIVRKVLVDTIITEKTFFEKLFKFLPFKKRRE